MRSFVTNRNIVERATLPQNFNGIPTLCFTFDDGWSSQYSNAFRIFNEYGIKGNVYVISERVGTSGYCTLSQLREMYDSGWCIANHTTDHSILTNQTDSVAIQKVLDCQNWLKQNGFSRGEGHLAWPYGAPKDTSAFYNAMLNAGIKTERSADTGYNIPTTHNLYLNRLHCLKVQSLNQNITLDAAKSYLDYAINNKKSVWYMGHVIDTQGVPGNSSYFTPDNLEELVEYAVDRNVNILTIDEWFKGLTNPRYRNNSVRNPV